MKISQSREKLTIYWDDNTYHTFFYFWLKDNAPKNRHKNGQKLSLSSDVDLGIQPQSAKIENDKLIVNWADETTVYPLSYLLDTQNKNPDKQTLWSKLSNYPLFNYPELASNKVLMLKFLEHIKEFGFAYLVNIPSKSKKVLDIVSLFGFVRETNYGKYYDVIAQSNPENLANTQLGLPPHTDNPYRNPTPTLQLLHCLKSDTKGGQTILVDGFNLAYTLKKEQPYYFKLLSTNSVNFKFKTKEHWLENRTPIILTDTDNCVKSIKFNSRSIQPFCIDKNLMLNYYKAYQHFEKQVNNQKNQLHFTLKPTQAIIYDNERILHGRTAYTLQGDRHLQGCYTDKDALYSKLNIIKEQLQ
ncbi:MAG: TauD/TfdA family dioxygenase [Tenacibaculum sp.]